MGLKVQSRRDSYGEPMYELTERLYLDSEGNAVGEDDPNRASLLGIPGDSIPLQQAERLGLLLDRTSYTKLTVEELRDLLRERELDTKGRKGELIKRLQEDDDQYRENDDEDSEEEDN